MHATGQLGTRGSPPLPPPVLLPSQSLLRCVLNTTTPPPKPPSDPPPSVLPKYRPRTLPLSPLAVTDRKTLMASVRINGNRVTTSSQPSNARLPSQPREAVEAEATAAQP